MKTFNKLISFAVISMTSLTYTACSDGFFDRYPTDSMQMETYLKNDAELQNIPSQWLLSPTRHHTKCELCQ